MATYPEWVTAHRQKGTEIRFINGQYYVYMVTSKWNPEKKRAQKITGKLIPNSARLRNRFAFYTDFFKELAGSLDDFSGMPGIIDFYGPDFQQVLNEIPD